jgi:hypothetical protein
VNVYSNPRFWRLIKIVRVGISPSECQPKGYVAGMVTIPILISLPLIPHLLAEEVERDQKRRDGGETTHSHRDVRPVGA